MPRSGGSSRSCSRVADPLGSFNKRLTCRGGARTQPGKKGASVCPVRIPRTRLLLMCSQLLVLVFLPTVPAARSGPAHAATGVAYRKSAAASRRVPGAELWVQRYDNPERTIGYFLEASPDGTKVFVTGRLGSPDLIDYLTIAYDALTGEMLWVDRYNGPAGSDDRVSSVKVSPDGSRVFVTGRSYGGSSGDDYATIAYDASSGTRLWVARHNGPGNGEDVASSLGVSPDGTSVFVTGRSDGGRSRFDYATVAYSAATGAELWATRLSPLASFDDVPSSLGVSPDGTKVFVTGQSQMRFDEAYFTVAHDASTGIAIWAKLDESGVESRASSLGVSPDGAQVYVTGVAPKGYATIAYGSSTGAKLWVSHYGYPEGVNPVAHSLGVSPDGTKVFVTGSIFYGNSEDVVTIAYSTN